MTHAKDLRDGLNMVSRLEVISLGVDLNGDEITSQAVGDRRCRPRAAALLRDRTKVFLGTAAELPTLELGVQAEPEDIYRTALGVVSRVVDKLVVEACPPRR